jgi:Na+/H+ antiporter NhaC
MIIFKINIGPMKKFEDSADEGKDLSLSPTAIDLTKELGIETDSIGSMWDLLLPIIFLVGVTLWGMTYTAGEWSTITEMLENTDVTASLFYGGLAAVAVSFIQVLFNLNKGHFELVHVGKALMAGIKSMLPANAILISAWAIGDMIGQLQTGEFLADVIVSSSVPSMLLPAVIFLIAAFMAFSTGTSWGTFGILLPIMATIALKVDAEIILVLMAATLSGAIFGDHCSPISDTTIMSSTGAQCNHVDHFASQIPYALICGGFTFVGYLIFGLTGSTLIPLLSLVVMMVAFVMVMKPKKA